jgi:UDP-glucose 4-epimerase
VSKAFITGACGFLGAHLVRRLRADGWSVVVFDRKPRTQPDAYDIQRDTTCAYIQGDVLEPADLEVAMIETRPDVVFHLAALADVRSALKMPRQQLDQNLLATFNVLEAMKAAFVSRIAFTSTAVVYGDLEKAPGPRIMDEKGRTIPPITERPYCFPQQTSIYGAMKLASESLISAYCEGYGLIADIYRLVSVVGAGYRHGNLMDFYTRLKADPWRLKLFGSPTQGKFYIAVEDVMDAIALTVGRSHRGCELWNVSHDRPNTIRDSIQAAADGLGIPMPEIQGGESWPGDLPQLVLDCSKLRNLKWSPKVDIFDAMRATIADLKGRHAV